MILVPTLDGLLLLTAADISSASIAAGPMNGMKLKLINSPTVTLNGSTQWGSVSAFVGGFGGYTDGSPTFTAAYLPDSGGVASDSGLIVFEATGSTSPQNGYGLVLTDSGSTSVLFAGPFDAPPIPFSANLDKASVLMTFNPATASITCLVVS